MPEHDDNQRLRCEEPPDSPTTVLTAAEADLARVEWDEARRVAILPGRHDWEPAREFIDLASLREHLYQIVHAAWIESCTWDDDGPVEDLHAEEILRAAIAPYEDMLRRMGWLPRGGA